MLRDLQDGLVPVGFGVNKGFGLLQIERLTMKAGYLNPTDCPLPELEQAGRAGASTPTSVYDQQSLEWDEKSLGQAWKTIGEPCAAAFIQQVKKFRRKAAMHLLADAYFPACDHAPDLNRLYPAEVKL